MEVRRTSNRFCVLIVYITLICNFLILYGNALNVEIATSIGTRVMVTAVFIYGIISVANNIGNNDRYCNLFCVLFVISFFIALISSIGAFANGMIHYLCFIMLPIYLYAFYFDSDALHEVKSKVYLFNYVYIILFVYLFFSDRAYAFQTEWGLTSINELTLGFGNQNETAMYLLVSFVVAFSAVYEAKPGVLRIIAVAVSLIPLYLIYLTGCRMALIVSLLVVFCKVFKITKITQGKEQMVCILTPLVTLVLALMFSDKLSSYMLLGEILGVERYHIYQSFLSSTDIFSILLGRYSVNFVGNLHNSYLSIIAAFGVPFLVVYMRFLYFSLKKYQGISSSLLSKVAYLGFLGIILHGIAEAALLVLGTVYAGMVSMIIILMLPDSNGDCHESNNVF